MTFKRYTLAAALAGGLVAVSGSGATRMVAQEAQTPDQRVAALKQSLADSQTRLRRYEWIETTIISLKGEEKARKQQRCYYGADGKLQKVPVVADTPKAQPAPSGGGGGRGRGKLKEKVVENKKDDMKDYMERAAALIQKYVPPQPANIQKVKDSGKLVVAPQGQGLVRLELPDYLQPGDRFIIDVNGAANNLTAVNVSTYLDKPDDAVTLAVRFATLADGTSYTAQTTLDAKAKNIRVVTENSGHRPLAP
jgi:hypothetical protein